LAGISSLPFLFFSFISVLRERRKIIDIPFWYRKCLATEQAETQKFGALPLAHWWFGVPVFGSICIFFLKEKYREYRNIIIQHLFAQIIFVISLYYFENSPIILLALLPFLWLAMGVKENIHTRIPIVGHAAL
jgi:hypothetical protein